MVYKQVIIIRGNIKMNRGKIASQSAHASLTVLDNVSKKIISVWKKEGQKKVVLKAKDLDELKRLEDKCRKLKLPCALISDAGLTEVKKGTITALGIGPDEESKINKVTGSLPLMK